jgi:signal transduction histidine kinase
VLERVLAAEGALNEAAGIRIATFVDSRAAAQPLPLSAADFSRVLQNLVVNAREALQGRKPAHIWITLDEARAGGEHVLLVEDDGPGLEPAHLGRVFEPGFSTKASGSDGRGLSIVRTLIEAAGGSIRARNRSSGGAAFEARFPLGNEPGRR